MDKIKRIVAIAAIAILVGLYIVTLVFAIIDHSATMVLFKGCVALTIFIPIAAYCYICLHKYAMTRSGRKNYYDPNNNSNKNDEK